MPRGVRSTPENETVMVEMLTNMFSNCRMSGVLIPGAGETVELSTADAEALFTALDGKHAKAFVESESEPAAEPAPPAE